MADIARASGEFATNGLAVITVGSDTHEDWYATFSDTGMTRSSTTLRDLGGGSDIIASANEGGTITLGAIFGGADTDPYKVLDGYQLANTEFTMSVAVTNGTFTGTLSYTGCRVLTVPGPDLDGQGGAAVIPNVSIGYAARTVAFT